MFAAEVEGVNGGVVKLGLESDASLLENAFSVSIRFDVVIIQLKIAYRNSVISGLNKLYGECIWYVNLIKTVRWKVNFIH